MTYEIVIEERKDHSWCELPDGRCLYGRSMDDVVGALDALSNWYKANLLLDGLEVSDKGRKIEYNM